MKKNYEAPVAEKIEFAYRDQVVAASQVYDSCIYDVTKIVAPCWDEEFNHRGPKYGQ